MNDEAVKQMVERFLGWTLPDNFNPDAGISFVRNPQYPMPTGTNLLDYTQAEQMVRHMLGPIEDDNYVAYLAGVADAREGWFVKKPIPVRAKQWFKGGEHESVVTPPPHCTKTSTMRCEKCGHPSGKHGWIQTLEGGSDGAQLVCPGDWIITGVRGEHYPCKPDIFAETYQDENHKAWTEAAESRNRKLQQALTSVDPFSGGRDGDECLWCRRDKPRDLNEWKDHFDPENHNADCEVVTLELARVLEEGSHEQARGESNGA